MYRIIGIDKQNRLKIIKNISLYAAWHTDCSSDVKWDSGTPSSLYTSLNGSGFLNSIRYVPKGWESKISETTWNIGDSNGDYATAGHSILNWEDDAQSKPAKIGLMYLSDYYYSYNVSGNTNCRDGGTSAYNTCKSSWLHISNNGGSNQEWTMSRYGFGNSNIYYAWEINTDGSVNAGSLDGPQAVRPVFYLDSSVVLTGEGRIDNPFMIQM